MDNDMKTARPVAVTISPERWRAIILGVVLWLGLFGVEISLLPPWGVRERPATQMPKVTLLRPEPRGVLAIAPVRGSRAGRSKR